MRRWGPALAAVLVVLVLGIEGSALGQPQAPQAYRLRVDCHNASPHRNPESGRPRERVGHHVDPQLIPLGTKLHVPGYGPGLAADVGYAIKGKIIDVWFPTMAKARQWGRRTVTITVYR